MLHFSIPGFWSLVDFVDSFEDFLAFFWMGLAFFCSIWQQHFWCLCAQLTYTETDKSQCLVPPNEKLKIVKKPRGIKKSKKWSKVHTKNNLH